MSIIRTYGNLIINLSKVISIERAGKCIEFTMPISNNFWGFYIFFRDDQQYKVKFNDEIESMNEFINIKSTLTKHYEK
mgnify:CR=1 FL=1